MKEPVGKIQQDAHLTISSSSHVPNGNNQTLIGIIGALTQQTLPHLTEPLLAAIQQRHGSIVLDLRQVSEIDSQGLALLLRVHKMLGLEAAKLTIHVTPGSQPERMLRLWQFAEIMALISEENPTIPIPQEHAGE